MDFQLVVVLVVGVLFCLILLATAIRGIWRFLGRSRVLVNEEPIPPYFGVSYVDHETGLSVCHMIPMNFLVGALQTFKLRLKRGLDVRVEPGQTTGSARRRIKPRLRLR